MLVCACMWRIIDIFRSFQPITTTHGGYNQGHNQQCGGTCKHPWWWTPLSPISLKCAHSPIWPTISFDILATGMPPPPPHLWSQSKVGQANPVWRGEGGCGKLQILFTLDPYCALDSCYTLNSYPEDFDNNHLFRKSVSHRASCHVYSGETTVGAFAKYKYKYLHKSQDLATVYSGDSCGSLCKILLSLMSDWLVT